MSTAQGRRRFTRGGTLARGLGAALVVGGALACGRALPLAPTLERDAGANGSTKDVDPATAAGRERAPSREPDAGSAGDAAADAAVGGNGAGRGVEDGGSGGGVAAPGGEPEPSLADASVPASDSREPADTGSASPDAGNVEQLPSDAASPSESPPRCRPSGAGPYAVLEGEELSFRVECLTGLDASDEVAIEALPAGASYDAASATFRWTPQLDQAAVYELTLRSRGAAEISTVKIAVADRFDAPDNVPVLDPSRYSEEFGLPVVHLTTDPALNDDQYTPASVTYRGHTYDAAEAKFRGTVSASYPKRSFTLKFSKADKFDDPSVAGGFRAKRKVVLITSFDDNSYVRQRLSYALWNLLGPAPIRIQSFSAVLYLNGQYFGLYTVADHIDGYLMEDHGLFQDGNLYKARGASANFYATNAEGQPKVTPHDGFSKEQGFPQEGEPDAFTDLDEYVSWVIGASDQEFASELDTRAERRDYENWWLMTSFAMADDSVSKNAYHYHDPNSPTSRWRAVPWDFNHSFGQDWRTHRTDPRTQAPEAWYLVANNLFKRILRDPSFGPELRARYAETLQSGYAVSEVLAKLEQMRAEITPSAHRDEQKWQTIYRSFRGWDDRNDFTTFEREIDYVARWITDRHAYLTTLYPKVASEPP